MANDQCITVRQRTVRYLFVPYSACISLFQFTFFSCCTFFMLHFFRTASFPCCSFLCSNLFMLHFFSCCTLFMYYSISCDTFTRCNVFVLHSSAVAFFACSNSTLLELFMLHHFQRCSQEPQKHLKWRALQQLTKPWHFSSLQCFRFAFFSCCILRMLQFFSVTICSCCTISRGGDRSPTNI